MDNRKNPDFKRICDLASNAMTTTMLHQFSESLGTAIDAKDPFTSLHSEEVAEISYAIALAMGLDSEKTNFIHIAGHLHDIGKIGVPDAVLKKPGALTQSEWKLIKRHPDTGADILRPVESLLKNGVVDMVRHHHERFDGNGYPSGLKGCDIPLGARIIALADTLSAILQNRLYRSSRCFDQAVAEINRCSGSQFDPEVVKAFMGICSKVHALLNVLNPGHDEVA